MKQYPSLPDRAKKNHFFPDYIAKDIADINFDYLKTQGIKACLVDLDDTIVVRNSLQVEPGVKNLLCKQPLPLFIATNRPLAQDLQRLAKQINAQDIIQPQGFFGKPAKRYYRNALKLTGYSSHQLVMIGDHILQDVWGANRIGLKTLTVAKLSKVNLRHLPVALVENLFLKTITKKYRQI